MPKSQTPQMPANAPKNAESSQTITPTPNAPETSNAAAPMIQERRVDQVIADAEAIAAGSSPVRDPGLDSNSTPTEMRAGTPANPKTLPLIGDEVKAFALVRSNDGMWRAVCYRIKGATVLEVRTKEPDLKALLAAQITDCLALDMPLFNDEEAPRE